MPLPPLNISQRISEQLGLNGEKSLFLFVWDAKPFTSVFVFQIFKNQLSYFLRYYDITNFFFLYLDFINVIFTIDNS